MEWGAGHPRVSEESFIPETQLVCLPVGKDLALRLLPCPALTSRPPPLAAVARKPGLSGSQRHMLGSPGPGSGAQGRPRCGQARAAPLSCARANAAAPPSPSSSQTQQPGEPLRAATQRCPGQNPLSPRSQAHPFLPCATPAAAAANVASLDFCFFTRPSHWKIARRRWGSRHL